MLQKLFVLDTNTCVIHAQVKHVQVTVITLFFPVLKNGPTGAVVRVSPSYNGVQ